MLGVPGCEAGSTWLQSPPMREVAGVNAPLGDLRPWRQETPGAQKIRGSPACPSPTTFPAIARSLSLHSRPTSGLQCPWEAASVMTPDSCAPTTKPPPPRPPPPPLRLPPPPSASGDRFAPVRGHFSSIRLWQRLNGARGGRVLAPHPPRHPQAPPAAPRTQMAARAQLPAELAGASIGPVFAAPG